MRRAGVMMLASLMIVVGAATLGGLSPAAADKGGCPNQAAANAVNRANSNSAHGSDKQEARDCPTVVPTPTPPSADEADVWVQGVTVSAPPTASVGQKFSVFVGVTLSNLGPAEEVTVDTTVELTVPSGCSVSPAGSRTESTLLEKGQDKFIGIGWFVTCSEPDTFVLRAEATADLVDATDPDLNNNTGSDTDTTDVQ